MSDERTRRRQGPAKIIGGVPYPSPATTLSLLPGAAVGKWLTHHAGMVRGRLLDVGAGNQPYRAWYLPRVRHAVAVDLAPSPTLHARCGVGALPFSDATFDCILCTSVLEHVEAFDAAVAELARVLKPGGALLVTVPFLYPTHEAPFDFWRTTHIGLNSALERHGLVVGDVAAQGGPVLMACHYAVQSVVQAIEVLTPKLGPLSWILDNRLVRTTIAYPQHLARRAVGYRLSGLSKIASLGYMAAAVRPPAPTAAG